MLAERHSTGGSLRRVRAIAVTQAQPCIDIVVVDEIIGQIVEIHQNAIAERHDAAVLKINKALPRHGGLLAVRVGKAYTSGQRRGISLAGPERDRLHFLCLSLKDVSGGVKGGYLTCCAPDTKP